MSEKPKKPKKERPVYYDDGRSLADMSALDRAQGRTPKEERPAPRPRASFREQLSTYFAAVRMMILPMLVTMGIIALAFLLIWLWAK